MDLTDILSDLLKNTFVNGQSKAMTRRAGQMTASVFPGLGLSLGLISPLFTPQALGESVHTIDSEDRTQDTCSHLVLAEARQNIRVIS